MMTSQEEFDIVEKYISSRSSKVRKSGNGIVFNCFYHDDSNPSASWKMGRNKPLGYCAVCGSIYHRLREDAGIRKEKTGGEEFTPFEKFLYYNMKDEYKIYDFVTEKYLCSHFRMKNKEKHGFPRGVRNGDHITKGTDNIDTTYAVFCDSYLKNIKETINNGGLICYAEGEKDARTLNQNGFLAFTCGGVNTFKKELLPYLKGGKFVVFGDNDKIGKKDAEQITSLLNTVGEAVMIIPPEVPLKGDVSDFLKIHTREDLQKLIDSVMSKSVKETVTGHDTNKQVNKREQINHIVSLLKKYEAARNYSTTDKGSGALFADIFKNEHRYNPEWKEFGYYDGKKWQKDTEGMKARTSAKILVDALLQYTAQAGLDEKEQNNYFRYAYQLAQLKNRNAMLVDAKDKYCFYNSDLDKNNFLLNCQNGVLNLQNGKVEFLEHKPDLLLSKICNVEYNPNATCKDWEKYLNEVMQGNTEKIKYLQKATGICLTGDTKEETMFMFYGVTTRNGKSTYTETIGYMLGDYAATARPETLAVKPNVDSRVANEDIARLKGVRFLNVSEPPKKMVFDIALLKTLLGRDTITARNLYERNFEFVPVFKLFVNTNYLPQVLDDTFFSSGRVNVISFDRHFKPEEQDKNLKNRLKEKDELSGILNWAIQGLKMYYEEGLNPPEAVERATSEYRQSSDKIGNFINEMLIKSDKNSRAGEIYKAYEKWCNDNGYGCENKGNFFSELKNKGIFAVTGTIDGRTVRNIVKNYELGFIEVDESTPFD